VLEQRRLLSGLPDGSANVADLTAITSQGAVVTIDPMLQGPLQAPFDGMQVKAEVWQPDGKHILVGQWNGNWAMARYNAAGALDQTFGAGGKTTTDFGSPSDQALNVSLRDDGKILLMGLVSGATQSYEFAITRYNTDGSLDSSFAENGKLLTLCVFKVIALNKGTAKSTSQRLFVNTATGAVAPDAPTGLQVAPVPSEKEPVMKLTWDDVSGALHYVVLRSSASDFSADVVEFETSDSRAEYHDVQLGLAAWDFNGTPRDFTGVVAGAIQS